MSEEKQKNFYFEGKYFETEEEFFAYAKKWSQSHTDKDTFLRKWKSLGDQIWLNIELREIKFTNEKLNEIIDEIFFETMDLTWERNIIKHTWKIK